MRLSKRVLPIGVYLVDLAHAVRQGLDMSTTTSLDLTGTANIGVLDFNQPPYAVYNYHTAIPNMPYADGIKERRRMLNRARVGIGLMALQGANDQKRKKLSSELKNVEAELGGFSTKTDKELAGVAKLATAWRETGVQL